jgi:hypothetical protein
VGVDGAWSCCADFEKAASVRGFVSILLLIVVLVRAAGATFTETFSADPMEWEVWNPGAFEWDSDAKNLKVTWDSRQTNAFFYYKLPMTLTRQDAFAVEFTLRFDDLMLGIDPAKSSTFAICVGFLNLAEAKRTNYFRGSGVQATTGARSIAEFTCFPGSGFIDPTVGMALVSSNNQFAYSHSFPVDLTLSDIFRVKMSFDPAAQVMSMQLLRNGEAYGEEPNNTIDPLNYSSSFGDFRLDAFSITSYSDAGQNPPQFAGSVLAHGVVDDVVITWPDAPVSDISGGFQAGRWTVEFVGQAGWNYFLERTIDFTTWERVASGAGVAVVQLTDDPAPPQNAFYRVAAERL